MADSRLAGGTLDALLGVDVAVDDVFYGVDVSESTGAHANADGNSVGIEALELAQGLTRLLGYDADLGTLSLPASTTITAFGASLVDDANAAAALTTLGLDADLATFAVPGSTTISAFGATLVDDANAAAAIATLGLDADIATLALPASTTISAFGATLVDDANAAASIATLGLDADLATFALPASTTISAFGATLVDDANAAAAIATLGLDADLGTFALPASTTISAFGATVIDDANAAAVIATLGLDADIATLALPASTTISTFGASLIDDAAASNARTTLGLGTIATEAETNYALLAGRASAQTLIGGTGSGDNLTLQSTSHATRGVISITDTLSVQGGGTATYTAALPSPIAFSTAASPITFTLNYVNPILPAGLDYGPVYEFQQSAFAPAMHLGAFYHHGTYKNKTTVAANLGSSTIFRSSPTFSADAATITTGTQTDFEATTTYGVTNAGVISTTLHKSFQSSLTINTGATVTAHTGLLVSNPTGSGTLTTNIGVDIAAQTKGATNIGFRNAALTQLNGGLAIPRTTKTANYTTVATDTIVAYTTLAASRVVTLLAAATAGDGFILLVKDESGSASGSVTITVDGNGSETIDGALTKVINAAYGSISLYCNGSNWFTF